ncbi:MAG: hypothetical protein ACFCAD_28435, partial [Pleurocapsa sp.]
MSNSFKQQNMSDFNPLLKNIDSLTKDSLQNFSSNSDFNNAIALAFGSADTKALQTNWQTGNFALPAIEIVSASTINGANGAFSKDTDTIYLAAEFLAANQSNLNAVNAVILEEYGHYLDSKLNSVDSPGDEGAIFSALVRGEELADSKLQELKEEDDSAIVVIDGEEIAIEQALSFAKKETTSFDYIDGLLDEGEASYLVSDNPTSEGKLVFKYSFIDDHTIDNSVGDYAQTVFLLTPSEVERMKQALGLIENVAYIKFEPSTNIDDQADFKFI